MLGKYNLLRIIYRMNNLSVWVDSSNICFYNSVILNHINYNNFNNSYLLNTQLENSFHWHSRFVYTIKLLNLLNLSWGTKADDYIIIGQLNEFIYNCLNNSIVNLYIEII